MKYPMYAVRDVHVGFNAPLTDINDNTAKRSFAYSVNNGSDSLMNFAPKDYDLYKIAEFDTESGHIESLEVPVLVCSGMSVYGSEVK